MKNRADPMFAKLRNKFLILNMSMISVLIVAAFTVVGIMAYNNLESYNRSRLRSVSVFISPPPHGRTLINDGMIQRVMQAGLSMSFYIDVDGNGKILDTAPVDGMSDAFYAEAVGLAWNSKKNSSKIKLEGRLWQYNITYKDENPVVGGKNIIRRQKDDIGNQDTDYRIAFLDVTDSYRMLARLTYAMLMVAAAMLVVIYLISRYFAGRAIEPLEEAWEKQTRFISDASHELKTPLAVINANADALFTNQDETVKSQKKWLDYIKAETGRMAKLVGDLLYLARMEDPDADVIYTDFNLSNVVNGVILTMEAVTYEKDIALDCEVEQDITVKGDSGQINRVIMILLDNAIKYTDQKGNIYVQLRKEKSRAVFSIQNSGSGIAKEDLSKIFDRFYRPDPSRNRGSGGYGLGLPIAKAIVDRMGGGLTVESVQNESTTFVFTLGAV